MTTLDAAYVDTVEERRIVAIKPKVAFGPLFEIATTREGSGIVLVTEQPPPNGKRLIRICVSGGDGRDPVSYVSEANESHTRRASRYDLALR